MSYSTEQRDLCQQNVTQQYRGTHHAHSVAEITATGVVESNLNKKDTLQWHHMAIMASQITSSVFGQQPIQAKNKDNTNISH